MNASPKPLRVALGRHSYDIHIGSGTVAEVTSLAGLSGRKLRVLSDSNLANTHLPSLLATLGLNAEQAFIIPAGESSKSWDTAGQVLDWLLSQKLSRDGVLVALGGGVVGDMAGFCAALYQRGIAFVQVPTTLLAMVDSSVGGKTGVNHARGKNLIGAFHQPMAVVADLALLKTLPARELAAGAAEVIKCSMLGDAQLFAELEAGAIEQLLALHPETAAKVITRCCALKARIVAEDEFETTGRRALLNLGHTFGHAVETYTGYTAWLHGEAVGLGLAMAADCSARHGWISTQDAERCLALVRRAGLPVAVPTGMTPADFRRLMAGDKKVAAGQLRLVLMRSIGDATLTADFDEAKLSETLAQFCG
jgi:3-dehydroquinate synthase